MSGKHHSSRGIWSESMKDSQSASWRKKKVRKFIKREHKESKPQKQRLSFREKSEKLAQRNLPKKESGIRYPKGTSSKEEANQESWFRKLVSFSLIHNS